jgi:hypothetical protein
MSTRLVSSPGFEGFGKREEGKKRFEKRGFGKGKRGFRCGKSRLGYSVFPISITFFFYFYPTDISIEPILATTELKIAAVNKILNSPLESILYYFDTS